MESSADQPQIEAQNASPDTLESLQKVEVSDSPTLPELKAGTNAGSSRDSETADPGTVDTTTVAVTSAPSTEPNMSEEPSNPAPERHATESAEPLRYGPYSRRYYPHHQSYRLSRDALRELAVGTLNALEDGFYYPPMEGVSDPLEVVEEVVTKENEPMDGANRDEGETKAVDNREGEQKENSDAENGENENQKADGAAHKEENEEVGEGNDKEEAAKEVESVEVEKKEVDNQEDREENQQEVGDKNEEKHEIKDEVTKDEDNSVGEDDEGQGRRTMTRYDLKSKVEYTNEHTKFFGLDDETLSQWAQADLRNKGKKKSRILIGEYSTLVGSKRLHETTRANEELKGGPIGVLNFASAKKPGGGFLNGAQAQEESLARSSTLFPSLTTPTSKQFYKLYSEDPDNAFYTHAMVYSPSVVLFRDDKGEWTAPIEVDILTCAAVNAGDVRKHVRWEEEMRALRERVRAAELARRRDLSLPVSVRVYDQDPQKEDMLESEQQSLAQSEQPSASSAPVSPIIFASDPPSPPVQPISLTPQDPTSQAPVQGTALPSTSHSNSQPQSHSHSPYPQPPNIDPFTQAEIFIASAMHERIARMLYLFHLQGARHLVLGSFGTGVFQNSVDLVAGIFRDLLCETSSDKETSGDQEEEGEKLATQGESTPPGYVTISEVGKGKFKDVFDTVMFAILGGSTVRTFTDVFEGAEGFEVDADAAEGSEVEGMKDAADFRVRVLDGHDRA